MATPSGIAVATRQAASGYDLRALQQRKTYTTSWDINYQVISGVPASVMFVDPNGGLSYSQPLNLLPEQLGQINIIELDRNSGTTLNLIATFRLTSLKAVRRC
jgi:hypothetical protein